MSEKKEICCSLKMAKADQNDLNTAYRVMNLLDSMSRGHYPSIEVGAPTFFDSENWEHLQFLHQQIIEIAENSGGLSRVIGAAGILLNPKNNLIDPDDDCIELHPDILAEVKDAERYRLLKRGQHWSTVNGAGDTLRGEALDQAIDAVLATQEAKSGD